MKLKREIKVKVTALRTEKLCEQCKYGWTNNDCKAKYCNLCEMRGLKRCNCLSVEDRQPCPYFVRYKREA